MNFRKVSGTEGWELRVSVLAKQCFVPCISLLEHNHRYDETQDVAKKYQAACTPEFLVFDSDMKLKYHGQFDDSRPSKYTGKDENPDGKDIRAAIDAIIAGNDVPHPWKPSIGCNLKWR